MRSLKESEYIERVKIKNNDQIEITSRFSGVHNPISYKCKVCDSERTIQRATDLIGKKERKNPCKFCSLQKIAIERSEKAKMKILEKIENYPDIAVKNLFKQENKSDKRWVADLECKVCNYNWQATGTNITRSTNNWKGCPNCWVKNEERIKKHNGFLLKATARKLAETKETFIEYIKTRTDLKMNGIYKDKKTNIEFECLKCGHRWKTSPGHIHISGSGCPLCNSGLTEAKETYRDDVKRMHGTDIEVLEEYVNANTKIEHLCHKCNQVFKSPPSSIRKGTGCPNCRISKGEERIRRFLEKNDVHFIREWRNHNCKFYHLLPMDFYLPDYNIVIEFQGIQHKKFSPPFHRTEADLIKQQKRDNAKRKYCKENGHTLVEIWYDQMELIENILERNLFKTLHKAS